MRIGITGGTGFLGAALSRRLQDRGDAVTVFSRRGTHPTSETLGGLDAVVHLAGEPVTGRWTPERKRRIRDSRIQGTRDLVEAWQTADPRPPVLISSSAVGIYGERGDEILDENSAPGTGFLADVGREWEAALKPAETAGARVTCLRTGVVLHPTGGALAAMLPSFRLGLGAKLGNGSQWMPWIHLRDWVDLVLFSLDRSTVRGPLNLTAPHPVRNLEFTRALASAVHRPGFLAAPRFALRVLLGEMADMVLQSQRVIPARAEAQGFVFSFPRLGPALEDLV